MSSGIYTIKKNQSFSVISTQSAPATAFVRNTGPGDVQLIGGHPCTIHAGAFALIGTLNGTIDLKAINADAKIEVNYPY
jgi:hypothetical protein